MATAALTLALFIAPTTADAQMMSITSITSTSTTAVNSSSTNPIIWPQITATSAIVYDPISNITYYEKNADQVQPIASLAKLATAVVVEDLFVMNPRFERQTIKIKKTTESNKADRDLKNDTNWTPDILLKYMLLGSSNKAAENLASQIIPRESFMSLMNFKAKQWGLTSTHFYNPSGISVEKSARINGKLTKTVTPGAESTSRELVRLMWYAIEKYPDLLTVTKDAVGVFYMPTEPGKAITLQNTDKLLDTLPIVFGKTGFTDLAGGNLAIVVQKNPTDHPLVIVVLGSTIQGRFDDALALATTTQVLITNNK